MNELLAAGAVIAFVLFFKPRSLQSSAPAASATAGAAPQQPMSRGRIDDSGQRITAPNRRTAQTVVPPRTILIN
jgi:hypothetical protein